MESINKVNVNGTEVLIEDSKAIHQGGLKTLNGNSLEGTGDIEIGTTGISFIEIHYRDLFTLYKQSKLVPGTLYAITDYKCAYIHPATGSESSFEMEVEAPDVKYIILTATSTNSFDPNVQYIRNSGYLKIIECKYSIDPELVGFTQGMTTYQPTGVVYHMKDEANNSCPYDFKHVKFKRYAILDITANTRVDNGTGGIAGPFRAFCDKTTSYKWSDERFRVGAGAEEEKELVQDIYNGTWRGKGDLAYNNGLAKDIKPYHTDMIKERVKPYQNENYPYDKYLAWQTDMYANYGVSQKMNLGTCLVEGMSNIEVDDNDFIYRYTFDLDGTDATEETVLNRSTTHLVSDSYIYPYLDLIRFSLPNTVICMSSTRGQNSVIQNLKIEGRVRSGNTILVIASNSLSYDVGQILNTTLVGGSAGYVCGNLFIVTEMRDVHLSSVYNNYFNGSLQRFYVGGYIAYNTIFGHIQDTVIQDTIHNNVLFNTYQIFKVNTGETENLDGHDGEYTYSLYIEDHFYANIVTPCQYANFSAHFNSNTFRCVYNKGLYFDSSIQYNSFGWTCWGVRLGYGCLNGVKTGTILRSNISSYAFKNNSDSSINSSGAKIFNDSQEAIPNLVGVNIESYGATSSKINQLGTNAKNILASGDKLYKVTLTADSSENFHVYDYAYNEVTS